MKITLKLHKLTRIPPALPSTRRAIGRASERTNGQPHGGTAHGEVCRIFGVSLRGVLGVLWTLQSTRTELGKPSKAKAQKSKARANPKAKHSKAKVLPRNLVTL